MTTTTTTTAFPTWKPSPRWAALMEEAPPAMPEPPKQTAQTHDWGFGARGATKAWTPPAMPTLPQDWWKQDRQFA